MRHADFKETSLDAPAALGLLINLSGKMRMLSHRIAMLILCRTLISPADGKDERLHAALAEFRQIHATLRNGNSQLGIAKPVIEMISDGIILGPQSHAIIETFIERAEMLVDSRQAETVNAFVEFVAGPLLDRLNQITNHISHTLEQLHERQRQQTVASENAVHDALAAIEKVSLSVRIIAINAATEAVRAGEVGRGFSIIAKEIRALSDRAAELVQSVRTNLHRTTGVSA